MTHEQRQQAVVDLLAAGELQAAIKLAAVNEQILLDEMEASKREAAIIRFFIYFQSSSAFIN